MASKYVNRNSYPIYVPDNRGGQVMFRPGEFTTNEWFSRFVGSRKLTKEPIGEVPAVPNKKASTEQQAVVAPPKPKAAVAFSPSLSVASSRTFKDEDTNEYLCKNGVYQCKLCDVFRTGSSEAMRVHITEFHGRTAQNPQAPKPEEDSVVRSTMPGPSKPLAQDDMKVSAKKQDAPVEPLPVADVEKEEPELKRAPISEPQNTPTLEAKGSEKKSVFPCTHPGCEKSFTTANGLRMHALRAHPETK